MAWRRRHRHTMDNVWYFAASCLFLFLFGNLVMLQSYHGFVDTNTSGSSSSGSSSSKSSRGHSAEKPPRASSDSLYYQAEGRGEDVYNIRQLSRELLANRNLFQQSHHASEYFVMESRLRKLLEENKAAVVAAAESRSSSESNDNNNNTSLFSRYLDFSSSTDKSGRPVMLDCGEIDTIAERTYVASGWTKSVFSGQYGQRRVALKTVDVGGQDVTACMDGGSSLRFCYHKAAQKIVKEIVLLQALSHHNVIQVLGFCVPDRAYDGEGDTTVVMVTELGEPIDLIKLLQMSWEERLRISYDLTKLLHFLSQSARGALVMNDFRRQQFVLVDGSLKLSDVDDAGFDEPACELDSQCALHFSSANFTKRLPCVQGRCQGYNEYRNMFNAGRHFTTFLLPHGAPRGLRPLIDTVVSAFEACSLPTAQLLARLHKVVQLYKTGAYLNRTQPQDYQTSYKGLADADLRGQYDYRCRASMSGAGCTLSVYDQREAEDTCDADPECQGFVMTRQHTWTGRTLVHLKNGMGPPSVNTDTKLFVKPP